MKPIGFKESNQVLSAPKGREEEVDQLPVFVDNTQYVSCWKLTEDDLEKLKSDPRIWLGVLSKGHPPVYLLAESPFIEKYSPQYIASGESDLLIHYLKIEFKDEFVNIQGFDLEQITPHIKEAIRKMWNSSNDLFYEKDGEKKANTSIKLCLYLTEILNRLDRLITYDSNKTNS